MKQYKIEHANVAQVKERLSAYVAMAEQGKRVVVCRHNKPVAELVRIQGVESANRTRLGSARGSVIVKCDLTEPAMAEGDWGMLK